MRNILVLSAGADGAIVANMLRKELSVSDWQITIIDRINDIIIRPAIYSYLSASIANRMF